MKLLVFVIACVLVASTSAQFFGNQNAVNMQNNQFQGGHGGHRGHASIHSGGFFREKRQFFGNQNAQNMQNNQFGSSGMGGGMGVGGGMGMGGGFGGGVGGGFGQASVSSGNTFMSASSGNGFGQATMTSGNGFFRQKRQFFGNQNAQNMQNNQFGSSGFGSGVGGGMGMGGGFGGGNTVMSASSGQFFREKRFVNQGIKDILGALGRGKERPIVRRDSTRSNKPHFLE